MINVIKRNGTKEPFNIAKIHTAIEKAANAVGQLSLDNKVFIALDKFIFCLLLFIF